MNRLIKTIAVSCATLALAAGGVRADKDTAVEAPEFTLTRITDRVHIIYGPLTLPDERNRGFRNNPVIVLTGQGAVVLDPGGSAWAGEQVVSALRSVTDQSTAKKPWTSTVPTWTPC